MVAADVAIARRALEVLGERAIGLECEAAELVDAGRPADALEARADAALAVAAHELALDRLAGAEVDHLLELAAATLTAPNPVG